MSGKSAIEASPDRAAVDFSLANGLSGRRTAEKFGFSVHQVSRRLKMLRAEHPDYLGRLKQPAIDLPEIAVLFAATAAALSALEEAKARLARLGITAGPNPR